MSNFIEFPIGNAKFSNRSTLDIQRNFALNIRHQMGLSNGSVIPLTDMFVEIFVKYLMKIYIEYLINMCSSNIRRTYNIKKEIQQYLRMV